MYLFSSSSTKPKSSDLSKLQSYHLLYNSRIDILVGSFVIPKISSQSLDNEIIQEGYVLDLQEIVDGTTLGKGNWMKIAHVYTSEDYVRRIKISLADPRLYREMNSEEVLKVDPILKEFSSDISPDLGMSYHITNTSFVKFRKNYIPLYKREGSTSGREHLYTKYLEPFLLLGKKEDKFIVAVDDGEGKIKELQLYPYEVRLI